MAARELWVFGYGSLIWEPGFAFDDRFIATLRGYRRAFCMSSIVYRGTPDAPGLVLALDADPLGACAGVAYRVAGGAGEAVLAYLRERELVSYAYSEAWLPVETAEAGTVEAVAYVSNPLHPQYRGGLGLEAQADVIARAKGPRGPNADYLFNTVDSLTALGLADPHLAELAALVRARLAPPEAAAPAWPVR
jgi:cation transport protein ChaC